MAPRNTQPPTPPGNPWDKYLPTAGSAATPATPTAAQTRMPTSDELREVIIKAERAKGQATSLGVPEKTSQEILATGQRPDRGFTPAVKQGLDIIRSGANWLGGIDLPFTDADVGDVSKSVGGGIAKVAGPVVSPLYKGYTTATRFTLGLIKEADEELNVWAEKLPGIGGAKRGEAIVYPSGRSRGKAGFQWSEVMKVTRDPNAGFGNTVWSDVTGNPYADQLIGFLGEVFVDPGNLLSGGLTGVARTAVTKTAGLAPDTFRTVTAMNELLQAQAKAALKVEKATEALDAAKAASATADEIAEAARVVSEQKAALSAATAAVKAPSAPRVLGRDGAAALAQRLVTERRAAQSVIDEAAKNPARFAPEQVALARYTVNIFTDDLIKNTAARGYAGLIPGFKSAFNKATEAEQLLGYPGRLQIGFGESRIGIPGSERVTRPITYGLQQARELASRSVGIGAIVPTGEGGFFPAGLRRQRAATRLGQAAETTKNLEYEALDRAFRGNRVRYVRDTVATLARYGFTKDLQANKAVEKIRNLAKSLGKEVGPGARYTKDDLQSVLPYVTDAKARAAALPTLESGQRAALEAIQGALRDFNTQARTISGQTGREIGFIENYFPQMLSDETLAAIRKQGQALTDAVRYLKITALEAQSNFVRRTLEAGDEFFGVELTPEDLAKGVTWLNEIARKGGWKYGNFFEEDVLTVMQKYANTHADDMARQTTLAQAPTIAPEQFAREIETGKALIRTTFDPKTSTNAFRKYAERKAAGVAGADMTKVNQIVDDLGKSLDDIGTMGLDDASALVIQDTLLRDSNLKLNEALFGTRESPFELDIKRFATSEEILNKGFVSIGEVAPDIYADPRVLELFKTVKEITGDPGYWKQLVRLYDQGLSFTKAYMLATPRQVSTNLIGNAYMMTMAAGAKIRNLREGASIYQDIAQMAKEGVPVDDAVRMVSARLKPGQALGRVTPSRRIPAEAEEKLFRIAGLPVPPARMVTPDITAVDDFIEQAVADAYALYGGAGFGRYGEIGQELGTSARPGVLLTGPARGPRGVRQVSQAVGAIPKKTREVAQGLEDLQRFQFMWDGLRQGLTPEEAAARVKFYLFDYQDYTKLDIAGRRLFPFWMWMSRNTPLQLVLQSTSPRAYIWPEKFRRATEEQGAQEFGSEEYEPLPPYLTGRGAYVAKDMEGFGKLFGISGQVVDPGLPLTGYGEKGFFTEFLNSYEAGLIAPLTPALRIPLELYANRIAAFKSPLVYDNDKNPVAKRIEYAFRQTFGMPVSLFSRYIASVPIARRQEFVQTVFDLRFDENQPGDQAVQAAMRILGLPLQPPPREATKAQTIKANTKELEGYVKDIEEGKTQLPQQEEETEVTPSTGENPWDKYLPTQP